MLGANRSNDERESDGSMSLVPPSLSDGANQLRRCSLEHRDVATEAMTESWAQLHDWLLWAQHEIPVTNFGELIKDFDEAWEKDEDWRYFSFDELDGSFIGAANIYSMSGPEIAGIGYWVRTSRTGVGYATRASRLLTSAAFDHLPLLRVVEIQMDEANAASTAVARHLGFHQVARIPKDKSVPASSGQALLWRMERDEWAQLEAARSSLNK